MRVKVLYLLQGSGSPRLRSLRDRILRNKIPRLLRTGSDSEPGQLDLQKKRCLTSLSTRLSWRVALYRGPLRARSVHAVRLPEHEAAPSITSHQVYIMRPSDYEPIKIDHEHLDCRRYCCCWSKPRSRLGCARDVGGVLKYKRPPLGAAAVLAFGRVGCRGCFARLSARLAYILCT